MLMRVNHSEDKSRINIFYRYNLIIRWSAQKITEKRAQMNWPTPPNVAILLLSYLLFGPFFVLTMGIL
jgi:hypothetical protein